LAIPLLIAHVIAAMMWTGAVFMASLVDWPVLKRQAGDGRFPFEVVIGQGTQVFPWVYLAIGIMLVTSAGLAWMHWPTDTPGLVLLGVKFGALSFMVGSTLYGTLGSWQKIQFATHEEAFQIYGRYMIRAYIIFACGVAGHVAGILFSRRTEWFGW
jgi:hypothetical protein